MDQGGTHGALSLPDKLWALEDLGEGKIIVFSFVSTGEPTRLQWVFQTCHHTDGLVKISEHLGNRHLGKGPLGRGITIEEDER